MYIRVVVSPGAKKERIERLGSDHFNVSVKEKAERNAANQRMLEVLSAFFGIPTSRLKIVTGHHSRNKIINVEQ